MTPSVGRLVHYVLSPEDAVLANERLHNDPLARGNHAHVGHIYPMLIVRVWDGGSVNGQVFIDGNYSLWVTSRVQDDSKTWGSWHAPART